MGRKKKAPEVDEEFEEFLKTPQMHKTTCMTCLTCSEEVLANIKLYAEMKVEGSTNVSWNALAKHLIEKYDYKPSKYSLMRHCRSCLGEISKRLIKKEIGVE